MKNGLLTLGGLLAFLVSTICIGSGTIDLLIAHSMRATGSFHGQVVSVSRILESAVLSFAGGLVLLAFGVQAVRSWLKANPGQKNC